MLKINNKQYDNYNIEIEWSNFKLTVSDKKIKGIAPVITFNIENNIFIGIETILSKEILENMNINEKVNIKQILTDIIYKGKNGWTSIITGKYNCDITRINNNFKIEFEIKFEETEKFNIIIDSNIELI